MSDAKQPVTDDWLESIGFVCIETWPPEHTSPEWGGDTCPCQSGVAGWRDGHFNA